MLPEGKWLLLGLVYSTTQCQSCALLAVLLQELNHGKNFHTEKADFSKFFFVFF